MKIGDDQSIPPAEAAKYIASMLDELTDLARANNLATLAYFLEMASIEAKETPNRKRKTTAA